MKTFRYLEDPVFRITCLLYAVNRWGLKPHTSWPFLHGQFNDLLLLPAALPVLLWLQRRLGLRAHDAPPTPGEIAFHLGIWSVLFEALGPHLLRHATGDWRDVAAYTAGALFAWIWWRLPANPLAGAA